jgi:hypothetical protein
MMRRKLPWWVIDNSPIGITRIQVSFLIWYLLITESEKYRVYGWTEIFAMLLNQPDE